MALKREEVKREEAPRIETKREEPPRPEPPREEPLTQAKPKYRNNPKPDYPPDARRQKQEGVVYLLVSINARGRVEDVQVDQSSGFTLLDEAALKAVRRWEFEPARRGDTPVPTRVRVPIRFKLE
ncbi:MAG: energy transducer TonB [Abditibacteriales bacterium]|nr:energy transducer TonB [Abditibacteriales bacterium]